MTSESRDTAWLWCSLNSKNCLSRVDLHHCISCLRGLERKRCISAFNVGLYQFFCFSKHRHNFCLRCSWIHAFVFQLVFAAVFFGCAFTHSACKELFMNIQCMLSGLHGFSRHLLQYCLLLTVNRRRQQLVFLFLPSILLVLYSLYGTQLSTGASSTMEACASVRFLARKEDVLHKR